MNTNTPAQTPAPNRGCDRYGTPQVDFGSKFTSEVVDAARRGQGWAQSMVTAKREPVDVQMLHPKQAAEGGTLYNALRAGVSLQISSTSKDPSVQKQLSTWAKNLAQDFPAMASFTPRTLGERAANLLAAARCLRESLGKLASTGEVSDGDIKSWTRVISALDAFGKAAEKLHAATLTAPQITSVKLDAPARSLR